MGPSVVLGLLAFFASTASGQTQFFIEPIPGFTTSGTGCAIALDAQQFQHLTFTSNAAVWYARNTINGWSQPEYIARGSQSAIVLDAFGRPFVAYLHYENSTFTLKYSRKLGDAWLTETIETSIASGGTAAHLPLRLDDQGNPHIAYATSSGLLRYATKFGGFWIIETVDTGWNVSLALDSAGRPHVAYQREHPSLQFMYASKNEADWEFEIVQECCSPVFSPSLAIDTQDRPHICFGNSYQEILTYASKPADNWVLEVVDPTWNEGYLLTTLALAPDGTPHIGATELTTTEVRYATRGQNGWEVQFLDGAGHDPSIALDDRGRPHIVYTHYAGGGIAYPNYARQPESVEVIAASSDYTVYENGIDVVQMQVRTRRYYEPVGAVTLSADLVPTVGPTFHIGDDAFSLNVGEEHVSTFSWPIPDSSYTWEFDADLVITNNNGPRVQYRKYIPALFVGAVVARDYLQDYFGLVLHCHQLDPETECRYAVAAAVPYVAILPALTLYFQNMCKANGFWARQQRGRAIGSWISGIAFPTKEVAAVVLQSRGVPKPVIDAGRIVFGSGNAAMTCMRTNIATGSGGGGSWARDNGSESFVDSIAAWTRVGIDSTGADIADIVILEGDCDVRIEADGNWSNADSIGLVYAHVMPITGVGAIATVTSHVYSVPGSEASNAHSASSFLIRARSVHNVNLGLLHARSDSTRAWLRYAEFAVTEQTRMTVSVADTQETFPLYVDFNADGTIDQIHYPGGIIVGAELDDATPALSLALGRPNPFRPPTAIAFTLFERSRATLSIFDAGGRVIARPFDRVGDPGRYEITWDGMSQDGSRLPSGVYFARIASGGKSVATRLVLLR